MLLLMMMMTPVPPLSRPSGANGKDPSTSKHTHGIRTDVIVFVEVVGGS